MRLLAGLACSGVLLGASGCYLGHLAAGQIRLISARESIARILEDPATPAELREQLSGIARVREFASALGLEVDDQYRSFVPWPGDRILTMVVSTRPGEVDPARTWFPLVGSVPYKGFFDLARAETEAERHREAGRDVCVVPVAAYSTLGWLDDPVTGPMLRRSEAELVDMILHEFVHATVYVSGESRFNEGVANFIGEEGSVLFYRERNDASAAEHRRRNVADSRRVSSVLADYRDEVRALYASGAPGSEREVARGALEETARGRLARLPLEGRDPERVAAAARLNDACIALTGTYSDDLDSYAEALRDLGSDLRAFVARFREAAGADDPRAALLSAIPTGPPLEVRPDR